MSLENKRTPQRARRTQRRAKKKPSRELQLPFIRHQHDCFIIADASPGFPFLNPAAISGKLLTVGFIEYGICQPFLEALIVHKLFEKLRVVGQHLHNDPLKCLVVFNPGVLLVIQMLRY